MVASITPAEALAAAARNVGGHAPLARVVGVTTGAVWQRIKAGKPAAETWVLKIEAATGISKHDLRPDIYPRDAQPTDAIGLEPAR